jgi:hypothetical protein
VLGIDYGVPPRRVSRYAGMNVILIDQFELNRVVGCRVVLLVSSCYSTQWDVLLARREVIVVLHPAA